MSFTRRFLILPTAVCFVSFCFLGCEKPSQKEPEKEVLPAPPKSAYPFFRTLHDSKGRSIEAEILGRDASTVTFIRRSDKKRFTLALDDLAPIDETYLLQLPLAPPPADFDKDRGENYQRESKRKTAKDNGPTGYKKLLLARIDDIEKEKME